MNKRLIGIIATVLSAISFGLTPVFTCKTYEYGANPMTLVFMRSCLIMPVLYVLMKSKKESLHVEKRQLMLIAIVALGGSGLTTILLSSSYQYIGGGTATTLHFLYPMVVALACWIVYKEKLSKGKCIALGIATIGVFFFIDFQNSNNLVGVALAATSAFSYAFYMVFLEKKQLTHIQPFKLSFYIAGFVSLLVLLIHIFYPVIVFNLPPIAYGYAFLTSISSTFLGVVLLQIGIHRIGSTMASIFCLFEPITSLIAGHFILNEALTYTNIIGCVIILGAVVLFVLVGKKKTASAKETVQ